MFWNLLNYDDCLINEFHYVCLSDGDNTAAETGVDETLPSCG